MTNTWKKGEKWGNIVNYEEKNAELKKSTYRNISQIDIPFQYKNQENIKRFDLDEQNNLNIYCYTSCCNDDSEILKGCRGNIFCGDKLIVKTFGYSPEYTLNQVQDKNIFNDFSNDYIFFPSYEGTLLRVFYFNNMWKISTHKRLNAFKSKWGGSESFGSIFVNCVIKLLNCKPQEWEVFFDRLDKNNVYCFLILPTENNRIVSVGRDYDMLHVGTFDQNGVVSFDDDIKVNKPQPIPIHNINDLKSYVENIDINTQQGTIVFNKNNKTQIKVLNDEYIKLYSLRGNEPSIKYRYLQIRMNENIESFKLLYPNFSKWFELYEKIIDETYSDIVNAFCVRFADSGYIVIPHSEYNILTECKIYLDNNREANLDDVVKNIINLQHPSVLNKIIKSRCFNKTNPKFYNYDGDRRFFYNSKRKSNLF